MPTNSISTSFCCGVSTSSAESGSSLSDSRTVAAFLLSVWDLFALVAGLLEESSLGLFFAGVVFCLLDFFFLLLSFAIVATKRKEDIEGQICVLSGEFKLSVVRGRNTKSTQ